MARKKNVAASKRGRPAAVKTDTRETNNKVVTAVTENMRVVGTVLHDKAANKLVTVREVSEDIKNAAAETDLLPENHGKISPSTRGSSSGLGLFVTRGGKTIRVMHRASTPAGRDALLKYAHDNNITLADNDKSMLVTAAEAASESLSPIEDRFEFMGTVFTMVASGIGYGGIVSGPGGVGKSFSAHKKLRELGYLPATLTSASQFTEARKLLKQGKKDEAAALFADFKISIDIVAAGAVMENPSQKIYFTLKNRITPNELYNALYAARYDLTLFDDVAELLEDMDCVTCLMCATDDTGPRIMSSVKFRSEKDTTPSSFEYKGTILILTNLKFRDPKTGKPLIHPPLLDRFQPVNLSMTELEKITHIGNVLGDDAGMQGFINAQKPGLRKVLTPEIVRKGLEHMKENLAVIDSVSFRVLVGTLSFVAMGNMKAATMSLRRGC